MNAITTGNGGCLHVVGCTDENVISMGLTGCNAPSLTVDISHMTFRHCEPARVGTGYLGGNFGGAVFIGDHSRGEAPPAPPPGSCGGCCATPCNPVGTLDVTFRNSLVADSKASLYGGGAVFCPSGYVASTFTIENNVFRGNSAGFGCAHRTVATKHTTRPHLHILLPPLFTHKQDGMGVPTRRRHVLRPV